MNPTICGEEKESGREKKYWKDILSDEITSAVLPYDYLEESNNSLSSNNEFIPFQIPEKERLQLLKISNGSDVRLHMILTTVLIVMMSKILDQEDILLGVPIYKQQEADADFINIVLPLKTHVYGESSFKEHLTAFNHNMREAVDHQNYPIDQLTSPSATYPFFKMLLLLDSIHEFKHSEKLKIDNIFRFSTIGDSLQGQFYYNAKMYKEDSALRYIRIYMNLLSNVLFDIHVNLNKIELITEEEKKMLQDFNKTETRYPDNKTISKLFEEQVLKSPNNVCVVYESKSLTYKEINEKAEQLATTLIKCGLQPEVIVGLLLDRSLEMIIGILAVLKAGGAYLPIDPEYPKDRIEHMLQDSRVNIVLIKRDYSDKLSEFIQVIDLTSEDVYSNVPEVNRIASSPESLAYVIYTSGSTGKPKGVAIEHRSIVNTISWRIKYYKFTEMDTVLQIPSFSFDSSVEDIFTPLLSGGQLVLIPQEKRLDLNYLRQTIFKQSIGHLLIVPSFYAKLLEDNWTMLKSLKSVTLAGESITKNLITEHYKKLSQTNLYNEYGPTENSVCSSVYRIDKDNQKVYIGKPINNVQMYVLNNRHQLQPIGLTGEIYLSGRGLSRGYLNNVTLTEGKFIRNPYLVDEKMYKTGDLGKWSYDGNMEFLGRIDNQVKIRGIRIELEEIENQLLKQDNIKEAVVLGKKDHNEAQYLVAYLVVNQTLSLNEVKKNLSKTLPDYMIPSYFVEIKEVPKTPNGKMDNKFLLELPIDHKVESHYEEASTDTEKTLVFLWEKLLDQHKIGINDNFFELGGHSLAATVLISKLHQTFNVEVPLKELFTYPTIKEIAEYIDASSKANYWEIERIAEKEYYETSSAQKRMYMIQQFDKNLTAYNMPGAIEFQGDLHLEEIEGVFKHLIGRHEALRTSFKYSNNKVLQKIHHENNFKLDIIESSDPDVEKIMKDFVKPFDLHIAPLYRIAWVNTPNKHYLLVDMHHIIADGVSIRILIKEFMELYNGLTLEPLRIQYKDFSEWQNTILFSDTVSREEEYWLKKFQGDIPLLQLPYDFERPVVQSFEGGSISFSITQSITEQLKGICNQRQCTIQMILLAVYEVLLSKYSGQYELIVGIPVSGRQHTDLQNLMGMFVNTLALKLLIDPNKSFLELLNNVKESSLNAYANQNYQLETLITKLNIKRDVSRNPLFDVVFNMNNIDKDLKLESKKVKLELLAGRNEISKFDLSLNVEEEPDTLEFKLEYCTKLFKKETIERMAQHYIQLLNLVCRNQDIQISELDMITNEEKEHILFDLNRTSVTYPKDKTVQELFEEVAASHPNKIAVEFENENISYRELNETANRLARVLKKNCVTENVIVGIMMDKSITMIIGMLAVLKAGGTYFSLDQNYPKNRLIYMIEDSRCSLILTSKISDRIDIKCDIINVSELDLSIEDTDNMHLKSKSSTLAFIMYTSGSTGNPKGIMGEHKNIVSLVKGSNYIEFIATDKILQTCAIAFDGSTFEIWGALLNGLTLCLTENETILTADKLVNLIREKKITIIAITTSLFNQLVQELPDIFEGVRYVIVGGEVLTPKHINLAREHCGQLKIINAYGPSENTTYSTTFHIDRDFHSNIPIGKPISNSQVYILGEYGEVQPVGIIGEIYVGGEGVTRGYLNRPELTLERFLNNPFRDGERIYKTGDLGRWLDSGDIEFLGRIDNQVKIRGHRIEVEEIENHLLLNNSIREVTVIDIVNKKGEKCLSAFVTSEAKLNMESVRADLALRVPAYMIPDYIMQIDKLPLTPNSKIDKQALRSIKQSIHSNRIPEESRNSIEQRLIEIWEEILEVKGIGIGDHFFECGGNSMKSIDLVNAIKKEFNHTLNLQQIFQTPTIKDLAQILVKAKSHHFVPIEKVPERKYYPMTSVQKRIYILNETTNTGTGYNLPAGITIQGIIDLPKFGKAINQLIQRHESLRTSFRLVNGEPVQMIQQDVNFNLQVIETNESDIHKHIEAFIQPFDLAASSLLRVVLFRMSEDSHIMLLDLHHIIADAISMKILIREFTSLYSEIGLPEVSIQYKDFTKWQNDYLTSEHQKVLEDYWLTNLSGRIPQIGLKTDYPRPIMRSFAGDTIQFEFPETLKVRIHELSIATGATQFMIFLTLYYLLLYKYTGDEDIIIGLPISGRNHRDLKDTVGMFVNTLVMRNQIDYKIKFIDFLHQIKNNSIDAYENQDYQYEDLVNKLYLHQDSSRNPMFDVMFAMDNERDYKIKLDQLEFKPFLMKNNNSKVDISLGVVDEEKGLTFHIEYCTALFKKQTIEEMGKHFIHITNEVLNNTDVQIGDIDLISAMGSNKETNAKKKEKIKIDFNI